MLEQLRVDPKKISQPSRDNISRELYFFKTDVINNFKAPWVTNALDGSENYLVWERTIALVGSHLKKFQDELKKKESPKSLKPLLRWMTPPKGVKHEDQQAVLFNKGFKLFQIEEEHNEDFDDGETSEDQDTVTSEAVATVEIHTSSCY